MRVQDMAGGAAAGDVRHDQVRHVLLAEGGAGRAARGRRRGRAPAHQYAVRRARRRTLQRHRQPH